MIGFLLAAAIGTTHLCDITTLDSCGSANDLLTAPHFQNAWRSFFKKSRGSYLGNNLSVFDQASAVLGGPPEPVKRLPTGEWFFSGCQTHDCLNKGAIVISAGGRILAFGLLSYDCHNVPFGQSGCELGPELTIFVQHQNGMAKEPFYFALVDWAKHAAQQDRKGEDDFVGPFQGVETRGIADEQSLQDKHHL